MARIKYSAASIKDRARRGNSPLPLYGTAIGEIYAILRSGAGFTPKTKLEYQCVLKLREEFRCHLYKDGKVFFMRGEEYEDRFYSLSSYNRSGLFEGDPYAEDRYNRNSAA